MTAKQRAARAKFKAVVAEAKKLRKKNPNLTQAQAVKQAWAISYSKEGKGKKLGEYHKDTKSHNVNIRVVSGIKINYKRGKLGALPVNFTGKILGVKFRVYNQFNLDGSVTAQVVEDDPKGYTIVEINGRLGEAKAGAGVFYGMIERRITDNLTEKEDKIVKSRIFKFLDQLSKEVKAYNSGKDKRTKKNEKLVITTSAPKKATTKKGASKKATGVKAKIKDILRSDKKRLKYGYTIVPGKVMAGIKRKSIGQAPSYKDPDAAREIELYADNDSQLYFQMRKPILINLAKKYKKGTYDIDKAAKLWRYYVEAAMKKYNKEFGSRSDKWFELLNTHDRNLLATDYAIRTKQEFDLGNLPE
jgi:hypothetical protein